MEVILREDVQHLGAAGDVVKVKDGYARNYLLPKGLAYPATDANKKKIAYEAERIAKQRAAEKGAAETEATRIADVHLTFTVKVGEEDKLYGSVSASSRSSTSASISDGWTSPSRSGSWANSASASSCTRTCAPRSR